MKLEDITEGQSVRINTPGESHHKRTGTVMMIVVTGPGRVWVDLGDVVWLYWPEELLKDKDGSLG